MKVLAKRTNKSYETAEMNHEFLIQVQNEFDLIVRPVGLPKSWECLGKYVIPAELLKGEDILSYSVGESDTSATQAFENAFDIVIKDYMQFVTEVNEESAADDAPKNKAEETASEKPKRGRKKKTVEEAKEEVVENVINEENVSVCENESVADTSAEMEAAAVNETSTITESAVETSVTISEPVIMETSIATPVASMPEANELPINTGWVPFNQDAITVEQEVKAAQTAMQSEVPVIPEPVVNPMAMQNTSVPFAMNAPIIMEAPIAPVVSQEMPQYSPVQQPMYTMPVTNMEQPVYANPTMNVATEQATYTNPVIVNQPAPMPAPTPVPVAVPASTPVQAPTPIAAPVIPAQTTSPSDIWNQEITFGPLAHQDTPVTIATAPVEGLQWYINNIKETSRFYYLRQAIEAYLAQTQGV